MRTHVTMRTAPAPLRFGPVLARFVAELSPARGPGPRRAVTGRVLPTLSADARKLTLCVETRHAAEDAEAATSDHGRQAWVLGSGADLVAGPEIEPLGNGVTIVYDPCARSVVIQTSIVGVPPVFAYEAQGRVILASDLWSLRCWLDEPLQFDPVGVDGFVRIGHPPEFRTLFESVRLIPGARRLTLRPDTGLTIGTAWTAPECDPFASWSDYVEYQTELFLRALRRIDSDAAFLSLTGGIDSRAILAGLLHLGRRVPARTMSWECSTLDARIANELCDHYRLPHDIVRFDRSFAKRLPDLACEASRLSGGLASIAQATEVAFYTDWAGSQERLSGYLGNQIGRGGQEGTRLRGCDARMLSAEVRGLRPARRGEHGRNSSRDGATTATRRLSSIQRASTFASLGNYCIGHHFALQESPYASRHLIEALGRSPDAGRRTRVEPAMRTRLRDLKHRFAGEPRGRSFQWSLVRRVGGFIADCRVNWGRRPRGGWSVSGLCEGVLALGDAVVAPDTLPRNSVVRGLIGSSLAGRSDFRRLQEWCPREYLYDTLSESQLRDDGLLSPPFIAAALDRYSKGDRHAFASLHAALDLSYASRVFTRQGAPGVAIPRHAGVDASHDPAWLATEERAGLRQEHSAFGPVRADSCGTSSYSNPSAPARPSNA